MFIKENVTIYKCEFCKKELKVKHAMVKHEDDCISNPKNFRICHDCTFCEEKQVDYTVFGFNGYSEVEVDKKANGFYCTKLAKAIYPYKCERKKLPEKYPETFVDQIPMKKDCEHFESSISSGKFNEWAEKSVSDTIY